MRRAYFSDRKRIVSPSTMYQRRAFAANAESEGNSVTTKVKIAVNTVRRALLHYLEIFFHYR
jgi:hypothetical protein